MSVTTHTPDQADSPLVLLQIGTYIWRWQSEDPDGEFFHLDIESRSDAPEWLQPFIDDEGDVEPTPAFWAAALLAKDENGYPLVRIEWRPYAIFTTLQEAESHAKEVGSEWQCYKADVVQALGKVGLLLGVIKQYDVQDMAIHNATVELTKQMITRESILNRVFERKVIDDAASRASLSKPLELPFTYNEPEPTKEYKTEFYAWADIGYADYNPTRAALKDSILAAKFWPLNAQNRGLHLSTGAVYVNPQTLADIQAAFPEEEQQ